MCIIITGNFKQQEAAQRALSALANAGFEADDTTTFFVNPPGQHDRYRLGGDEDESPGTEDAPQGSAAGAAIGSGVGVVVGLATMPVLGPAAPIAGAGVGAYVGSLYGALGNTHGKANTETHDELQEQRYRDPTRQSGVLVAVAAPAPKQQATAIRILRAHGATDIECPEGTIVAGDWTDFNPLTPLQRIVG
jgi:hypothetical protein